MAIAVVNKSHSATKSGPGRVHAAGHQKASPKKSKGAPLGFVQHTNPEARKRRNANALMGARQVKKARKSLNRQLASLEAA